jgi:uncharacterized protein
VRTFLVWLFVAGVSLVAAPQAQAEAKRALLVGINEYQNISPLRKAVGDVVATRAALEGLGFEIDLITNPDRRSLNLAISRYVAKLRRGDVALVHFSGHGIALDGENYLLPADIPQPGADKNLLKSEALGMSTMLEQIRAAAPRLTLLILDACRDNPFAQTGNRSVGSTRGLSNVETGGAHQSGVFIMYSAGFGQTALDRLSDRDAEPTSVYTRVLLQKLTVPGKSIVELAREVREDVEALALTVNHSQRPAYYDELSGPVFHFVPPDGAPARPRETAAPAAVPTVAAAPLPSFDCRRARWPDEIAVCNDSELASLDQQLSRLYYQHVDSLDEQPRLAFRRAQGDWLNERRACASNPACIARAYTARIAALQGVRSGPPTAAAPIQNVSPSFNCRRARTPDELAICANASLAAQDVLLDQAFRQLTARLNAAGRQALMSQQKIWLRRRAACGAAVACIDAEYETRILELRRM